jgi:hypothetical protein
MNMLAKVRITDPAESRQGSRILVGSRSTLRADGLAVDVIVSDLSETGCAIKGALALAIGTRVSIGLVGFGIYEAKVVRRNGDITGCAFLQPIDTRIVIDAFASATVIIAPRLAMLAADDLALPKSDLKKWPIVYRTIFSFGLSALLWAFIGMAILRVL